MRPVCDQVRDPGDLTRAEMPSGGERLGQASQDLASFGLSHALEDLSMDALQSVHRGSRQQVAVLPNHDALVVVVWTAAVPTPWRS